MAGLNKKSLLPRLGRAVRVAEPGGGSRSLYSLGASAERVLDAVALDPPAFRPLWDGSAGPLVAPGPELYALLDAACE